MDKNFQIREASLADLLQIIEIEARVFPDPWSETQLAFELSRQPAARNLVFVNSGQVGGYLMSHVVGDEASIINFAVDIPLQRQGLGRRLMAGFLHRLQTAGIRVVVLDVAADNQPALDFYRKFGFREIAIRRNYYANGDNALVMMKGLADYGLVQQKKR